MSGELDSSVDQISYINNGNNEDVIVVEGRAPHHEVSPSVIDSPSIEINPFDLELRANYPFLHIGPLTIGATGSLAARHMEADGGAYAVIAPKESIGPLRSVFARATAETSEMGSYDSEWEAGVELGLHSSLPVVGGKSLTLGVQGQIEGEALDPVSHRQGTTFKFGIGSSF